MNFRQKFEGVICTFTYLFASKQDEIESRGLSLTSCEAMKLIGDPNIVLIDLRDKSERQKRGVIPGSVHAPYPKLEENVQPGGLLHEMATSTKKRLVFYCAVGERSAMAVQAAQDAGLVNTCHIKGGVAAWKNENGPIQA